jgi:CBS domain containing-hemolysin-like protein
MKKTNPNVYQKGKSQLAAVIMLLFVSIFFSTLTSAQVSLNNAKVTATDKINSDAFIAKVGTARLVEFKKLQSLIIPKSTAAGIAPAGEHFIGQFAMTEAELVTLLGTPDVKVSNVIYQYNLAATDGCILLVGIDSEGFVSYSVLKACN